MCNFLRGDNVYEEKLEDIVYENFNITACLVHGQVRQGEGAFFSTVGKPRRINGFFYFYDCDGEYTLKNGEKKYAKRGDVVFLPPFCEYDSQFYGHGKKQVDCILVNLLFSDRDGKEFYLSDNLEVFTPKDSEFIKKEFCDILNIYSRPIKNTAEMKAISYKILSYFATVNKETVLDMSRYRYIANGIKYLETDIKQEKSIEEVAKMCNVSSAYFRRLFKEYSGLSPIQFRIRKKLDMAKDMLVNGTMSIVEISDYLGFENVTYFTRLFKEYEKISPAKYRNYSK